MEHTLRSSAVTRAAAIASPPARGVRERGIGVVRVLTAAPLVFVILLVADYVVSVIRPGTRSQIWLWTTATAAFPIWFVGAATLIAVIATISIGASARIRPIAIDVAVVLEFGLYAFGTRISPPTGDQFGWWQNSAAPNVAISEPLANVAEKIPYWITHDLASVRYVAPVFGLLTIAAFLVLARRLARMLDLPLWVFRAFVIASPLPFWSVTGYVENTFLALPTFFLGLERLLAFLQRPRTGPLVMAAAACSIAALFHAEFALMLIAFGAVLLVRAAPWRRRLRDVAIAVGVALAVAGLTRVGLMLLPVRLVAGNTVDGYDYQWFVPTELTPGDPLGRFTFFSHAHLIEVANIVVHAAPAVVLALPVVALLAVRRGRTAALGLPGVDPDRRAVMTALSCCSIAYLAFIAVWGFDFGPVGAIDLMLVMGAGLGLYAVALLAHLLRERMHLVAVLLMLSGAVDIAYYSVRVANAWL